MNKVVLVILIVFSALCTKAQKEKNIHEIINSNLAVYLEHGSVQYLLTDFYPFGFAFNDEIKKKDLQYVSIKNPSDRKKIKAGVYVLFFDGIEINKNQLEVKFSKRYVKMSSGKINISISDWTKYIYVYSCEKEEWVFTETIHGGI